MAVLNPCIFRTYGMSSTQNLIPLETLTSVVFERHLNEYISVGLRWRKLTVKRCFRSNYNFGIRKNIHLGICFYTKRCYAPVDVGVDPARIVFCFLSAPMDKWIPHYRNACRHARKPFCPIEFCVSPFLHHKLLTHKRPCRQHEYTVRHYSSFCSFGVPSVWGWLTWTQCLALTFNIHLFIISGYDDMTSILLTSVFNAAFAGLRASRFKSVATAGCFTGRHQCSLVAKIIDPLRRS